MLTQLIKNTESRFINYKELIQSFYNSPEWYKQLLRDGKNTEQTLLKNLIKEKSFLNEGLNPPYCYKF